MMVVRQRWLITLLYLDRYLKVIVGFWETTYQIHETRELTDLYRWL